MSNPSDATTNATNVRRRLRIGIGPNSDGGTSSRDRGCAARGVATEVIPRPKLSGLIARPRLEGRPNDPRTRTPLPHELARPEPFGGDSLAQLQADNQELRGLIEQAITQEEENDRQARDWRRRIANLEETISILKDGAGDGGHLVAQLQDRDDAIRVLTDQVQQLETHLQYAQDSAANNNVDQYVEAVQQRDDAIATLNARIAELEQQIADIPPPPPTDEELARMADELERERCMINQLRKELDDEKKQHANDEAEMEKQMRDMEVQMSKERAEIARQRTDLQRMHADIQANAESAMRSDTNIRDRLQQPHRHPIPDSTAANGGTPERQKRDSGFMTRLFGKR